MTWRKHLKSCLKLSTSLSLGSLHYLGIPRHYGTKTSQILSTAATQQPLGGGSESSLHHTHVCTLPPNPAGTPATVMHHPATWFRSPSLLGVQAVSPRCPRTCERRVSGQVRGAISKQVIFGQKLKTGGREEKSPLLPGLLRMETNFC